MNLRDRLLTLLREPNYSPGNEFDLSRRLGLDKKQRAMLAHEVRLVLKAGEFVRGQNGRIAPRGREGPRQSTEARPIFTPTRRGASYPSASPAPSRGSTEPPDAGATA